MNERTEPSEQEYREYRDSLVRALTQELFGPLPTDPDEVRREVLDVSPLQLYGTGVLFPQQVEQERLEDEEGSRDNVGSSESAEDDHNEQDVPDGDTAEGRKSWSMEEQSTIEDQPLNLANQFSPSAMGITFRVKGSSALRVDVSFGTYNKEIIRVAHPRAGETRADGKPFPDEVERDRYSRRDHQIPMDVPLPFRNPWDVPVPDTNDKLRLHATLRGKEHDELIISLMLVNHNSSASSGYAECERTFFQVGFTVRDVDDLSVFSHIDRPSGASSEREVASMDLLHRRRKSFCLGHGCAGDWRRGSDVENIGLTNRVRTSSIPTYEVKPVQPREEAYKKETLDLSMRSLAATKFGSDNAAAKIEICQVLENLCADYESWVEDRASEATSLDDRYRKTAEQHVEACRRCLDRMRKGVAILADPQDDFPIMAFRLANQAMLMQQVHTNLPERELGSEYPLAPSDDELTYGQARRWRPFQLAFILMNIPSLYESSHEDKGLVDLIWFPTGGGKTEAYLGLAAFAIVLRRLRGPSNAGTTILMRYTLRLLTAQQFQRASALIMCLDWLRQSNFVDADLGSESISIGLWVGRSLSPNKRQDAVAALRQLRREGYAENPFQVLTCPWCKCELTNRENLGYVEDRAKPGAPRTVMFRCPDQACEWGGRTDRMPISVIDEDIYEAPPTLVLGTVDKFAQIAWHEDTKHLFGIGTESDPPELIIQDELHLISGPLGTIVGLYEMAIERFCTRNDKAPKIVASTATIRNADDQCWNLYGRKAFVFPPQGLVAGDSYFAFENDEAPGRVYAGVFASGLKSHATAQVRTCSSLLQAAMPQAPSYGSKEEPEEIERGKLFPVADPYGTLVWYFNSLRELGHATTMCTGDIPEYLKSMCRRLEVPWTYRRYVREYVELTSRRSADEIPDILRQVERKWCPRPGNGTPVDILLATNMISVGVDVARLGLMVVTGQPKSTSEYIQATSRVGRRYPGLVVTTFNQGKSRDRSHYEQFISYHQSIYRFVEATSITPFSPPSRHRGLRGVLIALARLAVGIRSPKEIADKRGELETEIQVLLDRIRAIDPAEAADAERELTSALDEWGDISPEQYGWMAGTPTTSTLAFPYGSHPDPNFQQHAWPVLTSMRHVDGTAEGRVISRYSIDNE